MVNSIQSPLLFVFVCLLSIGCKEKDSPEIADKTNNVITLIFDKTDPPSNDLMFPGGRRLNVNRIELLYFDGQTQFPINRNYGKADTITINTKSDFILLEHAHHVVETYHYLIKKGDRVFFRYENETPVAVAINRKNSQTDYNIESEFQKKYPAKGRFLPINTYEDPNLLVDFSKGDYQGQVSKIRKESYLALKNRFDLEVSFLDSLYLVKAISTEPFHFYKDKLKYNELIIDLHDGRITFDQAKEMLKQNYGNSKTIPFSYYNRFASNVAQVFYIDKARPIDLGNTTITDYREAYDTVKESSLFDRDLKNQLLRNQLEGIAEYFSLYDFQKYFQKFEADVNDSLLSNEIRTKYFLEFNSSRLKTDSVYLMTSGKRKITLDEVIERNKGKIIYVDFWASWCGPCRAAMPDSKKLRDRYHKNVVFIYLSIDKEFDKWMRASKEEGLQDLDNSYLIVNVKTSDYLKKLDVRQIPRYTLIGKDGKLIQPNAPAPNSKEIMKIFEQRASE